MALGIKNLKRLDRFAKAYRRLNRQNQSAVDVALAELMVTASFLPAATSRKSGPERKGMSWAIRVNKGIRLTFEVNKGTCILRNVGEHDKTLDDS